MRGEEEEDEEEEEEGPGREKDPGRQIMAGQALSGSLPHLLQIGKEAGTVFPTSLALFLLFLSPSSCARSVFVSPSAAASLSR